MYCIFIYFHNDYMYKRYLSFYIKLIYMPSYLHRYEIQIFPIFITVANVSCYILWNYLTPGLFYFNTYVNFVLISFTRPLQ